MHTRIAVWRVNSMIDKMSDHSGLEKMLLETTLTKVIVEGGVLMKVEGSVGSP